MTSTYKELIANTEEIVGGINGIVISINKFLAMLSPGGALYGCGEEYLRNAVIAYLTSIKGETK